MAFLSLGIEKSLLVQEKDLLEYEQICYSNELNYITEEMAGLAEDDQTDSGTYAALESYQELYDSKKESIESRLQAINAEIDSYDKAISNNIKSECKLSISV